MSDTGEDERNSTTAGRPGHNQPVEGVHHEWPAPRRRRNFRVGIVEPARYCPEQHEQLFTAVITSLLSPAVTGLDAGDATLREPFDLLTWPEAFLAADTLAEVLEVLATQSSFPCVHVGLRANRTEDTHLFTYDQLTSLVARLRGLTNTVASDLAAFGSWLDGASPTGFYNVACVFFIDGNGRLRVGLHPKNIPSPLEVSALPEQNVTQGDFTMVVTLTPPDPSFYTVNIQPLICSDALDLPMDTQRPGPMAILTSQPRRVGGTPPEHIDIVSVVSCTPQHNEALSSAPARLSWQSKFRDSFEKLVQGADYTRHRHALVVLANIRRIKERAGGLSGCFVPLPLPEPPDFGDATRSWSWGRDGRQDKRWALVEDTRNVETWTSLAHLVALDPDAVLAPLDDHLFSFTVPYLLRERGAMDRTTVLSALEVTSLGRITSLHEQDPEGEANG